MERKKTKDAQALIDEVSEELEKKMNRKITPEEINEIEKKASAELDAEVKEKLKVNGELE